MPDDYNSSSLKSLQEDIYAEKIKRARAMTADQRFNEGLMLSNQVFDRMLEGAMWQLETNEESDGWAEVRKRLERLNRAQDHRFFAYERPQHL